MNGQWRSTTGIVLTDEVAPDLREQWVREGHCPNRDVHGSFRERVAAHPARLAVIAPDRELTYAELDAEVRRVASVLADAGLGSGDIVGIRMPNGWRMVVAELAVAAIGAVTLAYPSGRGQQDTRSLLGRSRATGAIFGSAEDVRSVAELSLLRVVFTFGAGGGSSALDEAPAVDGWHPQEPDPEAPARVLVTSGTEAEPKMIAYSHNAMLGGRANYVRAILGPEPARALMLMPLASSYGSCVTFVSIAALGATVVLTDGRDAATVTSALAAHRPTHLFAVPTILRRLVEGVPPEVSGDLRAIVSSSAPLAEATAVACRERFDCPVITVYGSSDGVNCHTARTGLHSDGGTGIPDPTVAEIRITDPTGVPLGPGESGEIRARGPMSPLCYVGAPELDERYRDREGWVRSGDLGCVDERGRLHVLGRLGEVVVRGGYNISPAEVEREIGAHPSVVDVACVPVPDPELGERLCACFSQIDTDPDLTFDDLVEFLEQRGLERRKLPEHVVRLRDLPLAATGKVCRRTVTAIAVDRTTLTASTV